MKGAPRKRCKGDQTRKRGLSRAARSLLKTAYTVLEEKLDAAGFSWENVIVQEYFLDPDDGSATFVVALPINSLDVEQMNDREKLRGALVKEGK